MSALTRDFTQFARCYPALPPHRIALKYAERQLRHSHRIPPDMAFMLTYVIWADLRGAQLRGSDARGTARKYSEDQPRVPAGSPDGGQWTSGDGGGNTLIKPTGQDTFQIAADIKGFTRHGINQVINRAIEPQAILDAINNPIQILPQENGTIRYIGVGAVVVLNPAGQVVTVWGQ